LNPVIKTILRKSIKRDYDLILIISLSLIDSKVQLLLFFLATRNI